MTTTYSYTASQAITAAFRKMKIYDPYTSSPSTQDLANGMEALNLLIKAWSIDLKIYLVTQAAPIPLTQGVATYTLGPSGTPVMDKPLAVVQAHRHQNDSGIDVPLTPLSRQEYDFLGLKTLQNSPTQFYFQEGVTNSTITVYPTPDSYTATNATLALWVQTAVPDLILQTDVPYFPSEWYQALVWNLAMMLVTEYDVPPTIMQTIVAFAREMYSKLEDWAANEQVGTYFTIDRRGSR